MIEKIEIKRENRRGAFEVRDLESYTATIDASYNEKAYRTNFYSLLYVTEGKVTNEIDFIEYSARGGELLVISNNRVHKYLEFEDAKGYIVMFTEGFMCEFLNSLSDDVKGFFKQSHLNPHIKSVDLYSSSLKALFKVLVEVYTFSNTVLNEEIIASTLKTLVQVIVNSLKEKPADKNVKNDLFVEFTDLVDRYIDREKTVEAYAKMMHVTEKTVNQVTRKALDVSAKQYIIEQLLQRIKVKLSFDQKSINEIAYDLGFSEASNMTRFFKKHLGVSPKAFRNKVMNDKSTVFRSNGSDLELIKASIEDKVYHIDANTLVPLHMHSGYDEVFYCFKGSGYWVLEDGEQAFTVGMTFVARAGTLHSLRSDSELYVAAILIPLVE